MAAAAARPLANDRKWHDLYPELGTAPVPIAPYVSREYFEREQALIFRKVWLNVARVEQVPKPGDYIVKDLAVCNTSVLIVRGKDGVIRAFHNMCSHRGNKLVPDASGNCPGLFACKFHGWAFGLDGSLRHISDEGSFFNLDRDALGLAPIAVDTWEGFIFINMDPHPSETLTAYLGEFGTGLSGYPFGALAATRFGWNAEVHANWKVLKDAFQEVWHITTLHRRSIPNVFSDSANKYGHALEFKLFPRHGRISMPGNFARKPTPVEGVAARYGSGAVVIRPVDGAVPEGLNPTRDPSWSIDGNAIFPNCLMYVAAQTYLTHTFWPLTENRTLWEVRLYYPKATTLAQRFSQEYSKIMLRDVNMEDGSTLERTQTMLASGARKEIFLQDQELLIRHHHKVAETYLSTPTE
ncbi:MAG TPA: aromatic ring-hydroxylating dioxygenase subunit alpha [Candidatus Binataceae bacterium]|nr:aromatic ring-hydroxylating dioxygenase subunit alpha [Candidatus Binataceae bacterium]